MRDDNDVVVAAVGCRTDRGRCAVEAFPGRLGTGHPDRASGGSRTHIGLQRTGNIPPVQQNAARACDATSPATRMNPSSLPRDTTLPWDEMLGEGPVGVREPDADGEVEFVGSEIEPPSGLGLKPLSHRRYYNKLVKVCSQRLHISLHFPLGQHRWTCTCCIGVGWFVCGSRGGFCGTTHVLLVWQSLLFLGEGGVPCMCDCLESNVLPSVKLTEVVLIHIAELWQWAGRQCSSAELLHGERCEPWEISRPAVL